MTAPEIRARIQPYQKTAATLAAENDIPLQGETVRETDTGRTKTGVGGVHYNDLPYDLSEAGEALAKAASLDAAAAMLNAARVLTGAAATSSSATPAMGVLNRYNAAITDRAPVLRPLSELEPGQQTTIMKADSSANVVTVTRNGTDTFIDDATTDVIRIPGESATYQVVVVASVKYWQCIDRSQPLRGLDSRYKHEKVLWLDDYGADRTGATDADEALAAAKADLGSADGRIELGCGTYLFTQPCPSAFGPRQGVTGQGWGTTTVKFTGTGAMFKAVDTTAWNAGGAQQGGQFGPFYIDGTGSGDGAIGIQFGDLTALRLDLRIRNFTGVGSIGADGVNNYTWTERLTGRLSIGNCTTHFKQSKGTSAYDSFGYGEFLLHMGAQPNQDGLVLENVNLYHGELKIRGNFHGGTTNTGTAIIIGRSGSADTAKILKMHLDIQVEANGTGVGHKTFDVRGTAGLISGYGAVIFQSVESIWTAGNAAGKIAFSGIWQVDSNSGKWAYWQCRRDIGLVGGSAATFTGGTTLNLYLTTANTHSGTLANGVNTVVFQSSTEITAKQGTGETGYWRLRLRQPVSGAPGTIVWPSVTWIGAAPDLTTVNNGFDIVDLYTTDYTTFYGVHVKPASAATVAAITHAATAKTTPAANDELPLVDSAASNALKKMLWSDLLAAVVASIVDSAPATLNTLDELAAALGDDPNFATTIMGLLAAKASLTGAEALQNKTIGNTNAITVKSSSFTVQDATDVTKQLVLALSGIATGQTRTLTVPNTSGTIVLGDNATDLLAKRIVKRIASATTGATWQPDCSLTGQDLAIRSAQAEALTIANPSGTPYGSGQELLLRLKDNGSAQTLTFGTAYRFSSDLPAPTTTVAGKTLYMWFIWDASAASGAGRWDLVKMLGNFT